VAFAEIWVAKFLLWVAEWPPLILLISAKYFPNFYLAESCNIKALRSKKFGISVFPKDASKVFMKNRIAALRPFVNVLFARPVAGEARGLPKFHGRQRSLGHRSSRVL